MSSRGRQQRNRPLPAVVTGNFLVASPEDRLFHVLPNVTHSHEPILIADPDGTVAGIVPVNPLLSHKKQLSYRTKLRQCMEALPRITPQTPDWKIAGIMRGLKVAKLPLFENGDVTSVVTTQELLARSVRSPSKLRAVAARLRIREPITASSRETAGFVQSLMKKRRVSRLVLMDDTGRIAGIISRSDLARYMGAPSSNQRFSTRGGNLQNYSYDAEEVSRRTATLGGLFTKNVRTLRASQATAEAVIELLASGGPRSVVITDGDRKPTGFVSMHDVLRAIAETKPADQVEVKIKRTKRLPGILPKETIIETLQAVGEKLRDRFPVRLIETSFDSAVSGAGNIREIEATAVLHITGEPDIVVSAKARSTRNVLADLSSRILKVARRSQTRYR